MITLKQLLKQHPEWADLPLAVSSSENPDGIDLIGLNERGGVYPLDLEEDLKYTNTRPSPKRVLVFDPN